MIVESAQLGGIDTLLHRRDGARSAPVFMFLHSIALDGGAFGPLAESLASLADVTVIAPDLRGHGGSAATPGQLTFDEMGADVVELVRSFDSETVHLVGQSMGSAVARIAASRAPELFASVTVAAGPPHGVPAVAARAAQALAGGMAAVLDDTLQRWFSAEALQQGLPCVRYATKCILSMDPECWAKSWNEMATFGPLDPLPASIPARCLGGSADLSSTPEIVEALRKAAGITAPVVTISSGTHQFFLERPADSARALAALWLGH